MSRYAVVYEAPEGQEGSWGAYAPDLPGLGVAAETFEECRELMVSGIVAHIEALRMYGYPVPEPEARVEELAVAA